MKNILLLSGFLFVLINNIFSQNIPLGPEQFEEQNALNTTDVMIDSLYYYKSTEVKLNAGEGMFLYMLARDFEPQISTLDMGQENWIDGYNDFFEDDAYISYIGITAKQDTNFNVIYSSVYEFDTGQFVFGMRKLNVIQMQFNSEMPFCDKLFYLINHWQCNWGLIPKTDMVDESEATVRTTNTLLAGGEASFNFVGLTDYSESLYSGYDRELADSKYEEFVGKITNCLSLDTWDIYQNIEFNEENEQTIFVSDFVIKGGEKKQAGYCFSIMLYTSNTGLDELFLFFY